LSVLNRRLHEAITARCPNGYLRELLGQTYLRLDRVRFTMFVFLPERSAAAVREHAHLLELLEAGDRTEIESYARWHKLQTVAAYGAIHQATHKAAAASRRAQPRSASQRSSSA
jgi:DNA-binding GntR family transcriptional regulator